MITYPSVTPQPECRIQECLRVTNLVQVAHKSSILGLSPRALSSMSIGFWVLQDLSSPAHSCFLAQWVFLKQFHPDELCEAEASNIGDHRAWIVRNWVFHASISVTPVAMIRMLVNPLYYIRVRFNKYRFAGPLMLGSQHQFSSIKLSVSAKS